MSQYLPILSMTILVFLFASMSFAASKILGPRRPTPAKEAPYECGIVPEAGSPARFPVKFYLVAMAFIVLDVEIVFLYPLTTVLRDLGEYGLIIAGVFLVVALVPFAYLLSTGAVDWGSVRSETARVGARVLHAVGSPGRDGLELPTSGDRAPDDQGPGRPVPKREVA